MKIAIAILGLALAAMGFAAPSLSADVNPEKKAAQIVDLHGDIKGNKEAENQTSEIGTRAKKDAKALAKQKKEQQEAAKKAAKLAKNHSEDSFNTYTVPEIDSSYAALIICLLAGAVAIRRERDRKA